ncbi:hypothetical protein BC826DRAFT_1023645 [Russula brevipes]|nr:hypothetical protein BC826DRAFT_1023645 [Russula brevipes]
MCFRSSLCLAVNLTTTLTSLDSSMTSLATKQAARLLGQRVVNVSSGDEGGERGSGVRFWEESPRPIYRRILLGDPLISVFQAQVCIPPVLGQSALASGAWCYEEGCSSCRE